MKCAGPVNRREILRIGGMALGGLSLDQLLAARAAQGSTRADTSVILIYCFGGQSHLETYDIKPVGPEMMRSVFRPIATRVPGINICEYLPLHAGVADKFSLIRSMTHHVNIHNDGGITVLTGKVPTVLDPTSTARSEHPDFGMIASRLRGPHPAGLPQYVSIPSQFHMVRPTYLGSGYAAFGTGNPAQSSAAPAQLTLRGQSVADLDNRRRLLGNFDKLRRTFERSEPTQALDQFRQQAYGILTSSRVAPAFDLSREDSRLRDRYGRNIWGQGLLLARRLAEAGTAVVSLYCNTPEDGPEFTNWDDHPGNAMRPGHFAHYMRIRLPYYDQAVSALIEDIFARGLEEKIMVVVVGEFGRTPQLRYGPPDRAIGRDHWPDAYSALVSGGCLKMGQVVGATDARGAYPADYPVTPQDLLATIYRHLRIDPRHMFHDQVGRPIPVLFHGEPIAPLL